MCNKSKPIEYATGYDIQIITREVYLVQPCSKSYFTEDAAVNKYAHILASQEYREAGKPIREPDTKTELADGTPSVKRGEMIDEYVTRQAEIYLELKQKIRDEKSISRLENEWQKANEKYEDAREDAAIKYSRLQDAITNK